MTFKLPDNFPTNEAGELAYIVGVDANGDVVDPSSPKFFGEEPSKWQNGGSLPATLGVGGGTVTYSFNGADYTPAQQAAIKAGLTLWSDIANVKFQLVSSGADVVFYGTSGASSKAEVTTQFVNKTDSLWTISAAQVYLPTDGSWGSLTSFTDNGGYGVDTVIHEIGHLFGLGHGGPYNSNVDVTTQQYSAYDNRLYSVMSYISPSDSTAKYYNSYTDAAKNADWGSTTAPFTPQVLDILAVQQVYGASTSTTYSGGQVFGFNCNISDSSNIYYDFTQDTAPVVTLFDYGSNNTLDLSGYGMACTVNLNQGAYSSVGGLVSNVGIAYGTSIDSAIGGGGDDIFYVNAEADHINGGAGDNKVVFSAAFSAYSISYDGAEVRVTATSSGVVDTLTNIQLAEFSDQTIALCFLAGTLIATPKGEVAVENLRPGDLVLTAQGEARPMVWLGRMTVATRFADPLRHFPIRIKAGALADNMPRRDLLVSPDHAILVENILVHAGALANGVSILRETALPESFIYYHVELDDHALILAEGAPAETFIDNADRMNFDNWAEHLALYPEGKPVMEMALPRAKGQRQIPRRIVATLDRRAEALGLAAAQAA